jgi:hypothetical protein
MPILVQCLLLLLFAAPALVQDQPAQAVRAAFDGYKTAILNNNGQHAVDHVSRSTFRYYEEMRDLALYGTEAEVKSLSTINIMQVLTMRHRVPTRELQGLSGTELVVYSIDRGWVGKDSVARLTIGEVTLNGELAFAAGGTGGPAGVPIRFVREDGRWRLDLTHFIQLTSAAMDFLAAQRGVSREQLIFILLSAVSGRQVNESIWQPPLKR